MDFEQIPIQVGSSRRFGTPYILGQFLPYRPLRLWPGGVQGCWQLLAEGKSFCLVSEAFFDHFRIIVTKHGPLLEVLCERLDAGFSQHAGKHGGDRSLVPQTDLLPSHTALPTLRSGHKKVMQI